MHPGCTTAGLLHGWYAVPLNVGALKSHKTITPDDWSIGIHDDHRVGVWREEGGKITAVPSGSPGIGLRGDVLR